MPEGPSIVIVKENLARFAGQRVVSASGTTELDHGRIAGSKIKELRSWGKHFLIVFEGFIIRIHFLMFGTYRVDERKELKPRLSLSFSHNHEINFYTCSVKWVEGEVEDMYDWSADVMGDRWKPARTKAKLNKEPKRMICDVLMDQDIFSGVGNIIKNEVLFRTRVHPEALVKNIATRKQSEIIREARKYSYQFLEWKKEYTLKKHWLIYSKKKCPRCKILCQRKITGIGKRRSFFCNNCQLRHPL